MATPHLLFPLLEYGSKIIGDVCVQFLPSSISLTLAHFCCLHPVRRVLYFWARKIMMERAI